MDGDRNHMQPNHTENRLINWVINTCVTFAVKLHDVFDG